MTAQLRHITPSTVVLLAAALATGCVDSESVRCAGGYVCAKNTTCHRLTDPALMTCVTAEQLAVCAGVADHSACQLGTDTGTCFEGACYPVACGDFLVDVSEACDDGNRMSRDGCSASCQSFERCGDGITDLAIAEQCDDGTFISGDGCSSGCTTEFPFWEDVTPQLPAPRAMHAMATDPVGGVIMFGGQLQFGVPTIVGDTWRWHDETWHELAPPTGSPPRRTNAAIAYDPGRERVLVFGGQVGTKPLTLLDDLWEWDGVTWTQRIPSGPKPSARADASFACSPTRCVLYGGYDDTARIGDLWSWNGTAWTQLGLVPNPGNRSGAAFVYDRDHDVMVLFGGYVTSAMSDTWELTATGWTASAATGPVASNAPSAAYDETSRIVVLTDESNATWLYNGSTWTTASAPVEPSSKLAYDRVRGSVVAIGAVASEYAAGTWNLRTPPQPRGRSARALAAYDARRGRMIVLDGDTTFEWDGRTWRRIAQNSAPLAYQSAMAFDVLCNHVVLFAGTSRETWRYQPGSGQWGLVSGSTTPPARSAHGMAYDADRGVVVLYGGLDPAQVTTTDVDDVWEWRGVCGQQAWVNVTPSSRPVARHGAALAYDPGQRATVLFGGQAGDGPELDDTWSWDGTTWTAGTPATRPPARANHAMAYDPRRRALVLFGGGTGALAFDDTWQWNGSTWSRIEAFLAPARTEFAMAQEVTGHLVVFGGEPLLNTNSRMFRLRSATTISALERCVLSTSDDDGDGLTGCNDPDCGPRCAPLCPLGETCAGPYCGNSTCDPTEDRWLCPLDCP